MYLTIINGEFFFYSDNTCYKTTQQFEIVEQRQIDFPFKFKNGGKGFSYFSNDYIQWFQTAECNGSHYLNVFDTVYKFEPFKATPLVTIPNYPKKN
jgi:hypothetical protein